jgi:hypothetical protein
MWEFIQPSDSATDQNISLSSWFEIQQACFTIFFESQCHSTHHHVHEGLGMFPVP